LVGPPSHPATTKAQEALAAEKELRRECEVLKRRSDGELRRVSKRCEALEADVGSLKKALEETERASRDLLKAETDARLRATREADLKKTRDEASRDVEWRVESLEVKLSSALESAKREKARADDAERALDDAWSSRRGWRRRRGRGKARTPSEGSERSEQARVSHFMRSVLVRQVPFREILFSSENRWRRRSRVFPSPPIERPDPRRATG
jgi:chaperonin cofactor prefoldin